MEVRYSREMNHNYMIIEAPDQTETYECRMLEDNPMEGLLRFRARQKEQGREFYYEITSRQPLSRILERQRATAGIIRSLLVTLEKVLDQTERFLLPEEGLVLDPDYIYVKPDPFAAAFCFIPGRREDFFSELSLLLKQILERTDHQDREAVVLAYNLYQTSLKEKYGICDLRRCLKGAEDSIFSGEKAGREEAGSDAWREEEFPEENTDGKADREKEIRGAARRESRGREDREWRRERSGEKETRDAGRKRESESWQRAERGGADERRETDREDRAKGERKGSRAGKVKRDQNRKAAVQSAAAALGAGALYWYATGQTGVLLCGLAGAVFFFSLFLTTAAAHRTAGKEREEKAALREENASWTGAKEGNSWELRPENEEERQKERIRQEKERMLREQREGTELLSGSGEETESAAFWPVDRGQEVIEIRYVPFVIGKHETLADFCLSRSTVSRLHLRVDRKEGVYLVTDLNSTNGTVVNGYALQANETVSIRDGDEIYLADAGFYFRENSLKI